MLASNVIMKLLASLAIILIIGGIGYYVYSKGASDERVETLQNSMDKIQERSETNAKIDNLDDAALCTALDGMWNKATQTCE